MALKTTVIGSWPNPQNLNIATWFEKDNYGDSCIKANRNFAIEEDIEKAIKTVIGHQNSIGIDVITDGEIGRENYIHHFCRWINNISFDVISEKEVRNGAYLSKLPTIVGPLSMKEDSLHILAKEWTRAQNMTSKLVKMTIPGPLTIADTTADAHYKDKKELCTALVEILKKSVASLVKAGCKFIQIDEPVLMRYPEDGAEFGIENLRHIFQDVDESVHKSVHLCCGYPSYLDQEDYLKADKMNYWKLAPLIDSCGFNSVSIEDAECKNDLKLLELFKNTDVILGCIRAAKSKVETVEEVKERIYESLKFIQRSRLWIAPDCGLAFLPEKLALEKLNVLAKAVKSINLDDNNNDF